MLKNLLRQTGICLPQKMNHNKRTPWYKADWLLFAVHFPWSITWTVGVYWTPLTIEKSCQLLKNPEMRKAARQVRGVVLPFLGYFHWSTQQTMPRGDRFWLFRLGRLYCLSAYADHKLLEIPHRRLGKRWALVKDKAPAHHYVVNSYPSADTSLCDVSFVWATSSAEAVLAVARRCQRDTSFSVRRFKAGER